MFYDDPDHVIRDEIVPLIDGDKFNEDLNIPDQKFVLPRALEITQALANILNMLPKIGNGYAKVDNNVTKAFQNTFLAHSIIGNIFKP